MTFNEWMPDYFGDLGELAHPFEQLLKRVKRDDKSALTLLQKVPELLKLGVFHEEAMAFLVADQSHLDGLMRSVSVRGYLIRDRQTASHLEDYLNLFVVDQRLPTASAAPV